MPKSRKNKHVSNKSKAYKRRKEFELTQLAALITDQAILDHCLIDVEMLKRQAMFQRLKPMLPFQAVFPSRFNMPTVRTADEAHLVIS